MTRKSPFSYKIFKEDLQPVPNIRIESEIRKAIEKANKIGQLYYTFSIKNGLTQIFPSANECQDSSKLFHSEIQNVEGRIGRINSKIKRNNVIGVYSSVVFKFQKCMFHLHYLRNTMIVKPKMKRTEMDNTIIDFALIYNGITPKMYFYKIENLI